MICHAPSATSAAIVNQAKFCTRTFVETEKSTSVDVAAVEHAGRIWFSIYRSCLGTAPLSF